jgi:hypothetical protein
MNTRVPLAVFLVPEVLLVIALGKMPWAYYQLLRLVVAVASAWIAAGMFSREKQGAGIMFIALVLAYNPFIPLRLGRGTWEVLNVGTIALLLVGLSIYRQSTASRTL